VFREALASNSRQLAHATSRTRVSESALLAGITVALTSKYRQAVYRKGWKTKVLATAGELPKGAESMGSMKMGAQMGYGGQQGYGAQMGYGAQQGYGPQMGYGGQQGYGSPSGLWSAGNAGPEAREATSDHEDWEVFNVS
jgi:hypothetical protein